ncbi:MAG: hypothetical protein A4E63_00855 [Syntrophorhabdus sp. PtaU1.Bin050]|nr:MAG: hypothetical protein A4E63_00855 [Syntrophorhabdus sp. PtaU1.Bin050]
MKELTCDVPQNDYQFHLFSQPVASWHSYAKIKLLTIVLIGVFTVALGAAVLHHHEDGELHSDCTFCVFLIQPAVSGIVNDIAGCLFLTSPEELIFLGNTLPSLCFVAAPPGRAPPLYSN